VELVGAGAPAELTELQGERVLQTGAVESVLPHLRRARVTVIPLRSGGGSRLKVLEALSAGVPVVATRFAVTGLGLRHGEHALLAERPQELAELALRVIEDDALALRLSEAGRRLVESRYAWSATARPLLALYEELAWRGRRP
jgi:glycosyltransferase involved in cell wall biosynthesis